jgi:hypothetical protein
MSLGVLAQPATAEDPPPVRFFLVQCEIAGQTVPLLTADDPSIAIQQCTAAGGRPGSVTPLF